MTNRCSVVFGPGRSGTSLTMKMLDQVGLRLSQELEPESEANPDGHFEDVVISRALQEFVLSLDLSPYRPRPESWRSAPLYGATRDVLLDVVRINLDAGPTPWGFKDPRTSLTWPMWQDIFEKVGVDAAPVFCSRDVSSVVRSLMRAYGFSQPVAEGLYLYRCLHALEDVCEPWFFVQYAEWSINGQRQLHGLASHCGIDVTGVDIPSIVSSNYTPSLDRQSSGNPIVLSRVVREFDEVLSTCNGTSYDPGAIEALCRSVRDRFDDFRFVHEALQLERCVDRSVLSISIRRSLSRAKRRANRLRVRR